MELEERLARAALTRVAEPDESAVVKAVADLGPVYVWDAIAGGRPVPGMSAKSLDDVRSRLPHDPRTDLDAIGKLGGRFLVPDDDEWPLRVDDLREKSPLGLWVRGPASVADVGLRSVAIVGSRAATSYGEHVASELAFGLADRGWAVVSGGAYGIDGAAHRGALGADGVTVAVLACGVDIAYPRGHERLFDRIVTTGAIISEWPPGCAPMRHRFLTRNRVIAALTAGTVVVEAGARSGANTTAKNANDLGRVLMAVPGPVTSALSVSCHRLLREEGVRCVTNAAEVIEEVGRIGELAPLAQGAVTARDALHPVARRLLDAVPLRSPAGTQAIAKTAGLSLGEVRAHLGALVVGGFVQSAGGGWRQSPVKKRASSVDADALFDV